MSNFKQKKSWCCVLYEKCTSLGVVILKPHTHTLGFSGAAAATNWKWHFKRIIRGKRAGQVDTWRKAFGHILESFLSMTWFYSTVKKNGQEDLQRMKEYCWKKTLSGLCFSENSNSTMTYQNHGCKKGENSSRGRKKCADDIGLHRKKSRSVGGTTAVCTFDVKVSVWNRESYLSHLIAIRFLSHCVIEQVKRAVK